MDCTKCISTSYVILNSDGDGICHDVSEHATDFDGGVCTTLDGGGILGECTACASITNEEGDTVALTPTTSTTRDICRIPTVCDSYLDNGRCFSCIDKYHNDDEKVCVPCLDVNCRECPNDEHICTECMSGDYFLKDDVCKLVAIYDNENSGDDANSPACLVGSVSSNQCDTCEDEESGYDSIEATVDDLPCKVPYCTDYNSVKTGYCDTCDSGYG